ncbi:MAG: translation initiation factor IF-2 N-terminal domain-containing protein, partial [Solirubrobacteraceae bacterium]
MSKKRVHEIAKEQNVTSKELLERLHAAGVPAKAAASSVDEAAALRALGRNGTAAPNGGSVTGAPSAQAQASPAEEPASGRD